MQVKKQQSELCMEQQTGSKQEKEYIKTAYQDRRRGLRFLFLRLGWDEVWKVKDFLTDFGEFVMLVGHPRGDEKMFRYMGLGGHRHE